MTALVGPLHLLALVLVISGLQKVVAPRPAAEAMSTAGLPVPGTGTGAVVAGTLLGLVEAGTGLAAIAIPQRGAAAVLAVAYLALAGFVVVLRRRDATASCGCFGSASTPPTTAHVVANLIGATVAAAATVTGVPDIVELADEGMGTFLPYVVLLVVGASLVLLAPALLARLDSVATTPRTFGSTR